MFAACRPFWPCFTSNSTRWFSDQGLEARAGDVAEVGEEVSAARVLRDEAEALALVEPLHGAGLGGGRHWENPIYGK
jgi:hypothetical protein